MSRLISRADILFALGYTPYPDDNPAAYFGPDEYDAHLPHLAAPKEGPAFTGPWSFSASGVIRADATVQGTLSLTGVTVGGPLRIGNPVSPNQPGIALLSSGNPARVHDALIEAIGGNISVDGQAVVNIRAAELRVNGGTLTAFGHPPPPSKPAAPTTLIEVVSVLRAFGMCT